MGEEPGSEPAAAVPNEMDQAPVCCFCTDDINNGEPVTVMWCGHVFHRVCLNRWRQIARKTDRMCPMRCHEGGRRNWQLRIKLESVICDLQHFCDL